MLKCTSNICRRIEARMFVRFTEVNIYADVSKWGRLRALPVADEASNKEWQRSKLCEASSEQTILGTATGHNGVPRTYTLSELPLK